MATIRTEGLLESLGRQRSAQIPVDQLPFTEQDATAGSEDELHAVVVGSSEHCDLPLSIRESRFFQNIARRSASGEAPRRTLLELEAFLNDTRNVWENSWIRFPESRLSRYALHVFRLICRSRATAPSASAPTRPVSGSRKPASPGCAFPSVMRSSWRWRISSAPSRICPSRCARKLPA